MRIIHIILAGWMLITISNTSLGKEWRGIIPLKSTRADVERLLGKPNGKYGRYEFENEWVQIFYSTGRCVNGWDVPNGTVIDIAVSPTRPLRLSDLKIDLSKYDKFRDPHTSHVYYTHRSEGIRYVVLEPEGETNGKILTAYYESNDNDKQRLYCRKSRYDPTDRMSLGQAWRQLRPLRTSRKQVERLLGRPKVVGGVSEYDFATETIKVFYLRRSCRIDRQGWNVPVNTVTSVHVEPKKKVRLAETLWNLSKFRKEPGAFDNPSHSLLVNEEDGVTLSVYDDVLDSYSYVPTRSDKAKRCPGYSIAEEQRLRDCMPYLFVVECSAEEISVGQPVSCRARFVSAPLDFSPTIDWSVSKNASFVRQQEGIMVSVRNPSARTVLVTGEVASPNICTKTATTALHVGRKS